MDISEIIDKKNNPSHAKINFADAAAAKLISNRAQQFNQPEKSNGWSKVKQNASRTVYRGLIDGEEVYLKYFHRQSLFYRLLRSIGISDAKREMHFMQFLSGHGIKTASPLASMCSSGIEWLATRAVKPAEAADLWHQKQLARGPEGREKIRQITFQFAQMIGSMHSVGVIHDDLHTGNLMVRANGGKPELVLMDLHRASKRGHLSRRAKAANLAQLFHDRFNFTSRSERVRFLKNYILSSNARGTLRGWAILVEHFAQRHTRKLYAKRDNRTMGANRYFSPIKLSRGWKGHVVLASKRALGGSQAGKMEFGFDDWKKLLANPETLFLGPDIEVVKDSRSSLVVKRQIQVGQNRVDVFIKRSRRKKTWKAVLDCFRWARATKAFFLGHALLVRRIATVLPLVALEKRVGPFLTDNILITEASQSPHLNQFLHKWLSRPPRGDKHLSDSEQRQLAQEVLWQLGRLVQKLHDNNFAHRDLKASNLLVHWSLGMQPEIVLVDLDGVSRRRHLTTRRKFQGLMRLNVSLLQCPLVNHAGQLRMLLGYLRRPASGKINFKPYWRVLERWSAKKLRNQIKSRRKRQEEARRPSA